MSPTAGYSIAWLWLVCIPAAAVQSGCGNDNIVGDTGTDTAHIDTQDDESFDSASDPIEADSSTDADPEIVCIEDISCPEGMIHVPCGPFVMGTDEDEGGSIEVWERERPEHLVSLSTYCLDLDETTNAEYRECVASGSCADPHSIESDLRADYYTNSDYDAYPVINVDWSQAAAYCEWKSARLPTEAEWEKAARGGCELVTPESCGGEDERWYPWGDSAPTCDVVDWCTWDTKPVQNIAENASPYGIFDMSGNVSEWVADWYDNEYYSSGSNPWIDPQGPEENLSGEKSLRGSSWYESDNQHRITIRYSASITDSGNLIGFRCAFSP